MSEITVITFITYFLAVVAIGVIATKRTKNVTDYAIGSRNLSAPVAGLSAGASDMSGWLLLGLPGAVYVSGLQETWILVGLATGAWANWRLVAPRLREETVDLNNALTLPQFFARRTKYTKPLLRVVTAGITIVFFTIYASAGFVAGAKLFEVVLGLSYANKFGPTYDRRGFGRGAKSRPPIRSSRRWGDAHSPSNGSNCECRIRCGWSSNAKPPNVTKCPVRFNTE